MADFSIIIVSYNNKKVITDCLNSIKFHNDIGNRLQVVVVEQSPDNDIYDFLKSAFPWITILRHENNGFGAGNNAGAAIADAPFLLFLNPDTILLEPICSFAVKKFQSDAKLGLFGVQLLDGNYHKNSSFMMKVPYGAKNKAIYKLCHRIGHFSSRLMYIQGADMFLRHDAFEKIGGFDENIFMYCEETDLCLRISEVGYKIEYDPSKRIIHLEGKSTEGAYDSVLKKQAQSFQYLCKKHNMPFKKIMRKEYLLQTMKLLMCEIGRRNEIDSQKHLIETLRMFI